MIEHLKNAIAHITPHFNEKLSVVAIDRFDPRSEFYVVKRRISNLTDVVAAYHYESDTWFGSTSYRKTAKTHLPDWYKVRGNGEWKELAPTWLDRVSLGALLQHGLVEFTKRRLLQDDYEAPKKRKRKPRVKLF